jgi:hypothetical protein
MNIINTKTNILSKSSLIFPILKSSSEYVEDVYWKNIFNDISIGKCPKCIYINGNNILSTNKKKQFSFLIPNEADVIDLSEFANEFKNFLINNTNLLSKNDNDKRKEILNKSIDLQNIKKWSDIKKKNIKTQLLINFVLDCKNKYKLKNSSAKNLYNLINDALYNNKTHDSSDIILKNNKINNINDIKYDKIIKKFINLRENENYEIENQNNNYIFYQFDKYVINKFI